MQFEFTVPGLGGQNISVWDSAAIRNLNKDDASNLQKVLDLFGKRSSKAQGLSTPITDIFRLKSTDQRLYLMAVRQSGVTTVLAGLKVGLKKLYVTTAQGGLVPVEPLCVLDFYVHESYQRQGVGKDLFEHFLSVERTTPGALAYDKPSQKLLSFLARHYDLQSYVPQSNNFVLFDSFWQQNSPLPSDAKAGRRAGGATRTHQPSVWPTQAISQPPTNPHYQPTYLTAGDDRGQPPGHLHLRSSGAGLPAAVCTSYPPDDPSQGAYQQQHHQQQTSPTSHQQPPGAQLGYEYTSASGHSLSQGHAEQPMMQGLMHADQGDSLDAFLYQSQPQSQSVHSHLSQSQPQALHSQYATSGGRPPYIDTANLGQPRVGGSSIHTPSGPAYLYRAVPAPDASVGRDQHGSGAGAGPGMGLDASGGRGYSGNGPYNNASGPAPPAPYEYQTYQQQVQQAQQQQQQQQYAQPGLYQQPMEPMVQTSPGRAGGGGGGLPGSLQVAVGDGGWSSQPGRTRRTWQIPESDSGAGLPGLTTQANAQRWSKPPWGTDQDVGSREHGPAGRYVGASAGFVQPALDTASRGFIGTGRQGMAHMGPAGAGCSTRGGPGVGGIQGFALGGSQASRQAADVYGAGAAGQRGTAQTARTAALKARAGSGAAGCLGW